MGAENIYHVGLRSALAASDYFFPDHVSRSHAICSLVQEHQHLEQCLLHTLNNIFQEQHAFTSRQLDQFADGLAPGRVPLPFIHPHRTLLLGNWDINVLECALQSKGKSLRWHDTRDTNFSTLDLSTCFGIIVNVRAPGVLSWVVRGRRHWFALRPIAGRWFNLDSNLSNPVRIANDGADAVGEGDAGNDDAAVKAFLKGLVESSDAKIFIVF